MSSHRLTRRALLPLALFASGALHGAEQLPWNMQETAMTQDGRLTFLNKPWWRKAKALKEGQSFTMDLNKDGRPDTMVIRKDGHIIEAIDDSGHAADIWNRVDTAYVVSYNGTGIVDRMVDYIDNDGDGKPDEMELRYYKDGYLRYAWFGENHDKDGAQIFDVVNWQYPGDSPRNKFRGNLEIYLNKYDPATKTWVPLSECPFMFWDIDGDGHSDKVLRVSAAPIASLHGSDSDYANNYDYMWAAKATPLEDMGVTNVRLSFNIDPRPRPQPVSEPHSTFGFNTVGAVPYRFNSMTYTNPRRRAPQTVTRLGRDEALAFAMRYPAHATGFTWDEAHVIRRWEGQFWIYERVYMSNTGWPTQRWNMRREYSSKPAEERKIYYSEADKRYHLAGAEQAWLEAGHLVNTAKDLEFRWFDSDHDGYLDTVEVYRAGTALPVRVSHFDPRPRATAIDVEKLTEEYNNKVLPEAIAEDLRFIEALKKVTSDPTALAYENEAAKATLAERRRYCLDIARELHFLKVRDTLAAAGQKSVYATAKPDEAKYRSLEPGTMEQGYSFGDSVRYWNREMQIHKFTEDYAAGRLDDAARDLAGIDQN